MQNAQMKMSARNTIPPPIIPAIMATSFVDCEGLGPIGGLSLLLLSGLGGEGVEMAGDGGDRPEGATGVAGDTTGVRSDSGDGAAGGGGGRVPAEGRMPVEAEEAGFLLRWMVLKPFGGGISGVDA
ncbi:ATP synthase subunit alpha [Striga asiatica]|uniref:ATP synthase subunit alpha n=1 Tax=Striga asiatica TaxID=4170 RepID=A0A5A7QBA8_STRAF|nr:ATP synthase subunit alpha [Striga asiatica]